MSDKSNIEQLFREHYLELYTLAYSLLKDAEQARDVVHDVFAELLASGCHSDKGKGYLLRCVRNRCLNLLREMPVQDSVERLINRQIIDDEDNDQTLREERLHNLHTIIRTQLTPQSSRVMLLRFEAGLSYEEIAEELRISKVAVYKHLKAAIEFIRKKQNCSNGQI